VTVLLLLWLSLVPAPTGNDDPQREAEYLRHHAELRIDELGTAREAHHIDP